MIPRSLLLDMLCDPQTRLSVTPLIDVDQVGHGSIDLRLGPDVIVSRRASGPAALDAVDPEAFQRAQADRYLYLRRGLGDSFHLQPGEFAIARSLEYVELPLDVSAEVVGRSSWGRLGLTIATATLVQPGFGGTITLELANVANTPIVLHVGLRIAQLSFHQTSEGAIARSKRPSRRVPAAPSAAARTGGRYAGQLKPELSRIERDHDLVWVAPMAIRYIIGVIGHRYAGKSAVVDILASRRQYKLYRFQHLVRDEAEKRGLDADDVEVLREVGDLIREEDGTRAALAIRLFEQIRREWLDPQLNRDPARIVVEGFKFPEELWAFGHLAAFRPLMVQAPPGVRLDRARQMRDLPAGIRLPRRDAARVERGNWVKMYLDEPADTRHRLGGVVAMAASWDQTLVLKNAGTTRAALERKVDDLREELERAWRAGRLEPEPDLSTALAGNVSPL